MDLNGAESFIATAVGHFLANEMHVPECSCPFRCMNLNAISFGAKGSMYLNAVSFDAKEMGRVEIFCLILKRIMNTELIKRSFTNIKHTKRKTSTKNNNN